jgi:hypothetical protein
MKRIEGKSGRTHSPQQIERGRGEAGRMLRRGALAGAALIAAGACAGGPPDRDGAAQREVAALIQRWSDAGEAGRWDVVADTYADSEAFAWIEQGEVRYASKAEIVAGLDAARAMQASIRNDVSDIVVTPLGADSAAYRARYVLAVRSAAFSFASQGVLAGVAIRENGRWKFLTGIFSEQARPGDAASGPEGR